MQRTTRTTLVLLTAAVLGFVACFGGAPAENPLLKGMHEPSDQVRDGCNIARKKCTRCHTMDQLLATQVKSPEAWRLYVHRMRLMPGADIKLAEEPKIVHCLVFRSFGAPGLAALEKGAQ